MPAFPLSTPLFSSPRPVLWSGLLLSLGVAVSFYFAAEQSIEHDTSERFSNQARNAQYSIASRINAYGDVLRGVAGFLQAGAHVDRAAFHAYVRSLDLEHRFPAIDTIDYAEYFSDEQRPAVERTWRGGGGSDGYPPFAIDPPGRRPDYTVLTLIEPGLGYRDQAGLDLATQDALAPALTRARDTGLMSSSGRLISFPGQPRHSGLGLRLPLYRADAALDTTPQRRAAYLGSVGIGFSVARLVQGALDDMPWHGVRLSLCDDGDAAETRPADAACAPLFDSQAAGAGAEGPAERYSTVLPIDFNGHLWQARFSAPKATLYARFDAYLPWLAMLTGFACSMLISMLFHTLSSSRLRAIKMAKAMTMELRDSQARLQLSHHKLRRLAAHADQIKEEERKRIAREIHDDLGQNLLVLRIEADMLATRTRHRHPLLHARARHAGPDRQHHQKRAPHHQRFAAHRAGPGPERGRRMADRPVPPAFGHGLRADRAPVRHRHRRPRRHRPVPRAARVAQQHPAARARQPGAGGTAPAAGHAEHDHHRQRHRHRRQQPQQDRLLRPGRHRGAHQHPRRPVLDQRQSERRHRGVGLGAGRIPAETGVHGPGGGRLTRARAAGTAAAAQHPRRRGAEIAAQAGAAPQTVAYFRAVLSIGAHHGDPQRYQQPSRRASDAGPATGRSETDRPPGRAHRAATAGHHGRA